MKAESEERAAGSRQTSGPSPSPAHPAQFTRLIDAVLAQGADSTLSRLYEHPAVAQMLELLKQREKAKEVALSTLR